MFGRERPKYEVVTEDQGAAAAGTGWRLPVLLYLLGVLYTVPLFWWPVARYDEGVLLSGAHRLLAGELPYRDFWTIYGPGQFALLAALFRVAGESLAVSRTWEIVVRALLPVLAFLIAARIANRRVAIVVWAILLVWLWQFAPTNYPVFPALAAVLGATVLLLDRRWAAAGVLVGVAALFRHDLGAYAALAHLLALGLVNRAGLRDYALGLVALTVPAWLLLALAIPWRELVADLLTFPGTVYPLVRGLPHPLPRHELALSFGPIAVAFHLTPLLARVLVAGLPLLVVGCAVACWRVWRRLPPGGRLGTLSLVLLAALFLRTAWVRSDIAHLVPISVPLVILLTTLAAMIPRQWRLPFGGAAALAGALLLALVMRGGVPRTFLLFPCSDPEMPAHLASRVGGACISADQAAAVVQVSALVPRADRIFVAATAHDRVLAGDASFYFLADRLPGTRYHELHPGLTTTREVQEAIVGDLERNRVPAVIRVEEGFWEEPNASRMSIGVDLLDRYLGARFVLESRVNRYSIYRRRPE
jgi:hypothetical protein